MKIALVNVYPDGNKGACALTWASLELVYRAFPGATVALVPIASTPAEQDPFRHTERRYPQLTILPALFDGGGRRWPHLLWLLARRLGALYLFDRRQRSDDVTLEWIRGCDLVVSIGGVIFHTCWGSLRDDASLLVRMLALLAAQRIDVPTVLVGLQLGPFRSWLGRWLSRRIAAKSAAVFPRDRTSAGVLDALRMQGRMIVLPDSALALSFPPRADGSVWERRGLDPGVPTLALAVSRALRNEERSEAHVALFAYLARGLVAAGHVRQVIVVMQTNEDDAISRAVAAELALEPRCVIDDDLDAEQLSHLYGACRLVVSSRMHAVLLALLAGVPAISLAPEFTFKERAVLEMIGLESLLIPSTTEPDRALAACLAIAARDVRTREEVAAAVAAARAQWDQIPEEIRSSVGVARRAAERPVPALQP